MDISFNVNGKIIEGELSGKYKNWKFISNNDYFISHFPNHLATYELYWSTHLIENPTIVNSEQENILDVLSSEAMYYLNDIPEYIENSNYRRLFEIAQNMTFKNKNKYISYVCAPMNKENLKHFKENYLKQDRIGDFRPTYMQEICLYEVKREPVFNTDEIELILNRVYNDKYIIVDR